MVSRRTASASPGPAMLNLATDRHVPLAMVSVSRGLVTVSLPMASASPGPRTADGQTLRETRVRGAQAALRVLQGAPVLVDRAVKVGPAVRVARPVEVGRLATESVSRGVAMPSLVTALHVPRVMGSASRGLVTVSLPTASVSRGLAMPSLVTALHVPLAMESASRGLVTPNLATGLHALHGMASVSRGLVTGSLRMASANHGVAMLNPVIVPRVPAAIALNGMVSASRGRVTVSLPMESASPGPAMENPVIVPRVPAATVLSVTASASPGPRTAAGQVLRETRVPGAQEATDRSAITMRIR